MRPASVRFVIVPLLALGIATEVLANDALPAPVQAVLERFGYSGEGLSISVRRLRDGESVLSFNASEARNPASTVKLLTTLVALDVLGPAHRWTTRIVVPEESDPVVADDVYFVGGGDPYLVEERIYQLLKSLRRTGMTTITGDLIVDDTYYDVAREDTGAFDQQPFRIYNVVPSAVLANFNRTRFEFRPGRGDVRISADPALPSLKIDNRLRLTAGRCAGYRRGISLELGRDGAARFSGRFPGGCKRYAFSRSIMPSWRYTGELVAKLWRQSGGELRGQIRRGKSPETIEPLVEFDSLSLTEIVRLINKHSSNVMTRHLVYELAAADGTVPATEKAGIDVIRRWLAERNFDFSDLPLENGAGKSRRTRMSTDNLVDLLAFGHQHRFSSEYVSSLPILGMDGTLDDRLDQSSLAGWGHLKTGSLDDVAAISGYLIAPDGDTYAIAVIHNANETHRGAGEALHHAVLRWISSQFDSSNTPQTRQAASIEVK